MIAAAHAVVVRQREALHGGEPAAGDGARIAGEIRRVLHEALRQAADGRGAQPDQRVGVVGGVALEIAVQPVLARGDAQLVAGSAK